MTTADLVSAARRRLAIGTRLRAADARLLATRYARWRTSPVQPRTVLYEAFSGNGVLDNPEAIFRYLLSQPDLADLQHTWVLNDPALHPEVVAEFADDPRVHFVRIRSAAYFRALATSAYLVNNATFPQEFAKRPEQVYLNTWHGVPLKHMGFDMPEGGPLSRNVLRNFLNADYLLSADRRKIERKDVFTAILVAIDEIAYFSATVGDKKDRDKFAELLRDLVARGRAVGLIVVAATQRPSSDIIPTSLRDLFAWRVAFRCTTDVSSDIVLGHGWKDKGWSANTISPNNQGAALLIAENGTPEFIKAAYLSDANCQRIAAYAASLRGAVGSTKPAPLRAVA